MFRFPKFKLFIASLLILAGCNTPCHADVVSLDSNYVAGQADITTKLNNDRIALTNGVNNVRGVYAGGVQSSGQIQSDTVGEENMADDANPRIRTAEGASCTDLVVTGLLPSTAASLVGSIPAGTAYPDGYRVDKTTSTAKTFTASKWTFVYLLTSGSFSYSEVSIGAATPSAPANSATLARVSTDASTIATVTDLRTVSCAAGPFSAISDAASEATLGDILKNGAYVRRFSNAGRTPQGFAEGAYVSWDTPTTFKVTQGCLYINGKYRCVSQDVTVPQTADAPTSGTSGVDTGSVTGGPVNYYVYGAADQDSVKTFSVSFSTNALTPTGVTNYRLIGSIQTDATNLFTSNNTVTAHGLSGREIMGAWANFNGAASVPVVIDGFNVSSITDNGTGDWTLNFTHPFNSAAYVVSGTCQVAGSNLKVVALQDGTAPTASAFRGVCNNSAGNLADGNPTMVMVLGDQRS